MRELRQLAALLALLFLLVLIGASHVPAHAQDSGTRIEVFLEQDPNANAARLYFMDPLTGLSTVANVENGRHFALTDGTVIYEKNRTGAVMRVHPDGTLEPHPFIRRAVDTTRLHWVTSPDSTGIAWVIVNEAGQSSAFVAWADGDDLRQLPLTPDLGAALYPLALSNDRALFAYDMAHPLTDAGDTPYPRFYHLTLYDSVNEIFLPLPNEPNCPCAAALTPDGRMFARLEALNGQGPFGLHVWGLPAGADIEIRAPNITFRQAGYLVLNENATLAAYSVAAGVGVEAGLLPEQYALVVVDAASGQGRIVIDPGLDHYRPLEFIDGDTALLVTHLDTGGTYKLEFSSGTLQQVSDKRYLGAITP